jgi:hypothetical protein
VTLAPLIGHRQTPTSGCNVRLVHSTHECDAWSDGDARRIFAHFDGDILILDALDKGLH